MFHICLILRHPKAKADMSKLCLCMQCAGPPIFGRYRCFTTPNDRPAYMMSSWEKDQVVRMKRYKIYLENIKTLDVE